MFPNKSSTVCFSTKVQLFFFDKSWTFFRLLLNPRGRTFVQLFVKSNKTKTKLLNFCWTVQKVEQSWTPLHPVVSAAQWEFFISYCPLSGMKFAITIGRPVYGLQLRQIDSRSAWIKSAEGQGWRASLSLPEGLKSYELSLDSRAACSTVGPRLHDSGPFRSPFFTCP